MPLEPKLPILWPRLYRLFTWYACRLLGKHFTAVRVSKQGPVPANLGHEPVVVYLNHPSWWDPMVGLALARLVFADRHHYAPIDAKALERYRFFAHLGFFGIHPGTPAGGTRFLRTALRITRTDRAMLWITAQGHFTDPRQRPVQLQAGLAHLAQRMNHGWIMPLALDYPFWDQKHPEVLLRVGSPIDPRLYQTWQVEAINEHLAQQLTLTQDALMEEAMTRQADRFTALIDGSVGTHKLYDAWRWLRAKVTGKGFSREHQVTR